MTKPDCDCWILCYLLFPRWPFIRKLYWRSEKNIIAGQNIWDHFNVKCPNCDKPGKVE